MVWRQTMETEVTIVFDIPIDITRCNAIIRLRAESIDEVNSPVLPIPCTAIPGDSLNLGTAEFNSSFKLVRSEQADSALSFLRLQSDLLGIRQSRSVLLRFTMATTTFDAVGWLSVLWRHTGERGVGSDAVALGSYILF